MRHYSRRQHPPMAGGGAVNRHELDAWRALADQAGVAPRVARLYTLGELRASAAARRRRRRRRAMVAAAAAAAVALVVAAL
jgi:hypothetical protein